ncbi:LuxR C-terminal-related transcriptional regulator [Kitasatospora brasiliensis]|uniref:LuxR C-terminal-related transcriptional regulator n=1 Tax=Kitasatospora brasiliensis TaxID=3058040 RepID=UPI0029311670|nr:LuxR C-terminal-related transcriptional regulator [Kitasatospora sp. K002]
MSEHDLPDAAARDLYREILKEGGRLHVRDIRPEDEPTIKQLADVGLLVLRVADSAYSAVNPRAVGERIGADLREESARLLAKATLVPELLEDLAQAYDAVPRRHKSTGGVRRVAGMVEIRHLIYQLVKDHPHEALCAQPGGPRPHAHMADSLDAARRYVEAGGAMLTVFEPLACSDPRTVEYARDSTRVGAPIRLLDGPFAKTLIFDRAVALVPAASDHTVAAVVEDSAMVTYLVEVFERQWEQAQIVDWESLSGGSTPYSPHTQVGRLLARGLTQRAIASRMGLSERTVAGHIARLRELYDAETLFQLGWRMRGTRTGESDG